MVNRVATLGYGFHLPETRLMLQKACAEQARDRVRAECIAEWPQASAANKEKMWNHLSRRYLEIENDAIVRTPFITMYQTSRSEKERFELIFYQLCQSTPLLLRVLRALAQDTLLDTGSATFTKFHLDQILTSLFGRVTKSTSERVRQILRQAGRLQQQGREYLATSSCPSDSVLGYGLYADADRHGWRAPSSHVVLAESDVSAAFLCNRPLLVGGVQRLARLGHCDYHTHGSTDQIQLVHQNLQEFVDAWKR